MKFAPAKKIRDFWRPNPSPAWIFSKNSSFRNFGAMHDPSLGTYNLFVSQRLALILSENKLQRYCCWMFSKLFRDSCLSIAKIRPKGGKIIDCTSSFVWAIAPAGAISLRCNHSTKHLKYEPRRREAMKFAPAKKIRDLGRPNPSPASIFSKFSSFRNFGAMHHPSVGTYNLFVSQRLAVILSENKLQGYCTWMISKLFRDSFFSATKFRSKGPKSIHRTSAFVWAIAHADAISLRCNHSTRHFQMVRVLRTTRDLNKSWAFSVQRRR